MESMSVVAIDKDGNYQHFYSYSDALRKLFKFDEKKIDAKINKVKDVCYAKNGRKSYLGYHFIPTGNIPEEEQKKRISHNNIPVVAYNDNMDLLYFDSLQQASKLMKVHESGIFKCLQGINKTSKQYKWEKAKEFDFLDFFERRYQYRTNTRRKLQKEKDAFFVRRYTEHDPILEFDAKTMKYLKEYKNLKEASEARKEYNVSQVVYGTTISNQKYTWMCKTDFCFLCCCVPSLVRWISFNFNDELFFKYYDKNRNKKITHFSPEYKIKNNLMSAIGQYDLENNLVKVYDHYYDYIKQFNLGYSMKNLEHFKNAIKNGLPYKGFLWRFLDKDFVNTPEYERLKKIDVSTFDFSHHTNQKIYKKFKQERDAVL